MLVAHRSRFWLGAPLSANLPYFPVHLKACMAQVTICAILAFIVLINWGGARAARTMLGFRSVWPTATSQVLGWVSGQGARRNVRRLAEKATRGPGTEAQATWRPADRPQRASPLSRGPPAWHREAQVTAKAIGKGRSLSNRVAVQVVSQGL
jgi:hypothetical protein